MAHSLCILLSRSLYPNGHHRPDPHASRMLIITNWNQRFCKQWASSYGHAWAIAPRNYRNRLSIGWNCDGSRSKRAKVGYTVRISFTRALTRLVIKSAANEILSISFVLRKRLKEYCASDRERLAVGPRKTRSLLSLLHYMHEAVCKHKRHWQNNYTAHTAFLPLSFER